MEVRLKNYLNGAPITVQPVLDTKAPDFNRNIRGYSNLTGNFVKDKISLELMRKIKTSQKNFYELEVEAKIHIAISFGCNKWPEEFSGSCNTDLTCLLSPAEPGLYTRQYETFGRDTANRIYIAYRKFFDNL